ncbi:IclR family transcriptional regulator [Paenarthrobacter ureafaciens]|uniref:IclR family transcriptional regulator n=1 Tax=Paenarthrobacter ureafaciens TaxID=37931 RepID=UPI003463D2AB
MTDRIEEPAGGFVRSVERAAALITAIAASGQRGCRLTDLVEATGLSKTTVHRLLGTLLGLGWVEQEPAGNTFHVGLPLAGVGIAAAERHGLTRLAAPHLVRLADLTGDTVYLSVRDGNRLVCVDRVSGGFPVQAVTLGVGASRTMGSCAGSIAILSGLNERELGDFLDDSRSFPVDAGVETGALPRLVSEARRRGYATSPTVFAPGVDGIGVPVRAPDGSVVAALSVESVGSRLAEPRRTHLARWLQRESAALTESLARLSPSLSKATIRRMLLGP